MNQPGRSTAPLSVPLSWLALLAGLSLGLFSGAFTPVNADIGWMLSFGRTFFRTGQVIWHNVQSFTEPSNLVVRQEWLVDIGLYALHHRWGAGGLIIAKWLVLCLSIVTLWLAARTAAQDPVARLLAVLVAVEGSWSAYELIRAQMITYLLIGWFVFAGLRGRRALLWTCVPLMAVWANCHGGFFIGIVVLALLLVAGHCEARFGGSSTEIRPREGAAILGASCLATFVSPFGWHPHVMALHLVTGSSRLLDREWLPLWRFSYLTRAEEISLVALIAVVVLAFFGLPARRLRAWTLLVLGVVSSVMASRHLRMAPVFIVPALAISFETLLARLTHAARVRLAWFAFVLGGSLCVLFAGLWVSRIKSELRFIDYPVPSAANAIAVLDVNDIRGNIWNDFDWGGLLIWAAPQVKVAIDGRHLSAYSSSMLYRAIELGRTGESPIDVLTHYGATLVLLSPSDPVIKRIATEYSPLYCDRDACLLAKNTTALIQQRRRLLIPTEQLLPSDFFQSPAGVTGALRSARFARGPPLGGWGAAAP